MPELESPAGTDRPAATILRDLGEDLRDLPAPTPSAGPRADRSARAASAAAYTAGLLLEDEERYEDALRRHTQALQADPANHRAFFRARLCALHLGRADDVLARPSASLPFQRVEHEALRAAAWVVKGDWKQAAAAAESARKALPHFVSLHRILAEAAVARGQTARLRPLFESARAVQSSRASVHVRLAGLWAQLLPLDGKTTTAQALKDVQPFMDRARKLEPDNLLLRLQSGLAAFGAGDYSGAEALLAAVHRERPRIPGLREKLALARIQLGRPADAIPLIEDLIGDFPERTGLHAYLGRLHAGLGRWPEAAAAYAAFHQLGRPNPQSWFAFAEAQWRAGRAEDALTTLRTAQREHPASPAFSYLRALILQQKEAFADSLAAFQVAEALARPDHTGMLDRDFHFRKALSADRAGEEKTMEDALRECLRLDPKDHRAMNYLAYSWAEKGVRLDEAEKLLLRALELEPKNGAYLDSLGWTYHQKGDHRRALLWLQKALAAQPDDGEILEHLGDVHLALGNRAEARKAWEKALRHDPPRPDSIRTKLQALPAP